MFNNKPQPKYKRILLGFSLAILSLALPFVLFHFRTYITPLHWAGAWVGLVGVLISSAIILSGQRRLKLITILLPLFLFSAVEAVWHTSIFVSERIFQKVGVTSDLPKASSFYVDRSRPLQAEIDFVYRDMTLDLHFMPDAIRLVAWPPNFRSNVVNTNSLGFRSREFTKKRNNTFRILAFGDSGLFGWNAPNDQSIITFYLEQILQKYVGEDITVEVLNLGVPSANSAIHYPTFATYGQSLQPDLVLLFMGLNDLSGSNVAVSGFNRRIRHHFLNFTVARKLRYLGIQLISGLDDLARKSKLYSAVVPPNKFSLDYTASDQTRDYELFKRVYFDNLDKIYSLARKLKIEVVAFEQPSSRLGLWLGEDSNKLDTQKRAQFTQTKIWSWNNGSPEAYQKVVDDGNKIAERYGYSHFGFLDELRNHRGPVIQGPFIGEPAGALFVSDAHYTPYGNQLIANSIAERIKHFLPGKSP